MSVFAHKPPMNADKRRLKIKALSAFIRVHQRLIMIFPQGGRWPQPNLARSESSRRAKNLHVSSTDEKTPGLICVNPCSSVADFVSFFAVHAQLFVALCVAWSSSTFRTPFSAAPTSPTNSCPGVPQKP
jgi:hypothetical protein